ncbi:MAG: hypothetical protein ABSE62_00420 [Chthoniobacteraceae bacterium]|jgi:hypothetical protein
MPATQRSFTDAINSFWQKRGQTPFTISQSQRAKNSASFQESRATRKQNSSPLRDSASPREK